MRQRSARLATAVRQYRPTWSIVSHATGYRSDVGKVTTVRWLGAMLLLITLIEAAPARHYYMLSGAPTWAQIVLAISLLQIVYVLWMVSIPDWSTVYTLMLVFAVVATLYGCALAVALVSPADRPMLFQMDGVRRMAPAWCAAMVLISFLGAFLCGRCSFRWYKAYVLAAGGNGY